MNLLCLKAICLATGVCLLGCQAEVVEPVVSASHSQGVYGTVFKWVGDFQPCGGCDAPNDVYPVDTQIFVCAGYVSRNVGTNLDPLDPESMDVIAVVPATAEGGYRVGLVPGIYTLFAEVDGRPYPNSYLGHPELGDPNVHVYAYSDVTPDVYQEFDMKDTTEASF